MKKKIIILLVLVLTLISIVACIFCTIATGSLFVVKTIYTDIVNDFTTWREARIDIPNYQGEVYFMAKPAHPILAEYWYQLKIKNGIEKTYSLKMNTGGQIEVKVYLISYESKYYIETREGLFDLEKNEEILNDIQYNHIRIFGKRQTLGFIGYDKEGKLKLLNTNEFKENKKIVWGDWHDIKSGKIRLGKEGTDKYLQIENLNKEREIFQNPSFSNIEDKFYLVNYKGKTFISINKTKFINIENLVVIYYSLPSQDDIPEKTGEKFIRELEENGEFVILNI